MGYNVFCVILAKEAKCMIAGYRLNLYLVIRFYLLMWIMKCVILINSSGVNTSMPIITFIENSKKIGVSKMAAKRTDLKGFFSGSGPALCQKQVTKKSWNENRTLPTMCTEAYLKLIVQHSLSKISLLCTYISY